MSQVIGAHLLQVRFSLRSLFMRDRFSLDIIKGAQVLGGFQGTGNCDYDYYTDNSDEVNYFLL